MTPFLLDPTGTASGLPVPFQHATPLSTPLEKISKTGYLDTKIDEMALSCPPLPMVT
jgi:hypothetical protein